MSTHHTDRELSALLDGNDDEALRPHIDECAFCRSRLRSAGPPVQIPVEATIETAYFSAPTAVIDVVPDRGDVWRLAWEEARELAVVLAAGDAGIVVAPLFDDPEEVADEWTLLFDASASDLEIEFGVGVGHRFTVPLFVFDTRLCQLDTHVLTGIEDAAAAYRRGEEPAGETGPALHGPLDPRIDALGEVIDEFVDFTNATWVEPAGVGDPVDWLAFGELHLVDTYRLYELSRGAAPEPHEVALAAEHDFQLDSVPFDETLVSFLDTPRNSARLRRQAAQQQRSEADVRRLAAKTMTNQHLALAARGGDASIEWSPLFERYLDEASD